MEIRLRPLVVALIVLALVGAVALFRLAAAAAAGAQLGLRPGLPHRRCPAQPYRPRRDAPETAAYASPSGRKPGLGLGRRIASRSFASSWPRSCPAGGSARCRSCWWTTPSTASCRSACATRTRPARRPTPTATTWAVAPTPARSAWRVGSRAPTWTWPSTLAAPYTLLDMFLARGANPDAVRQTWRWGTFQPLIAPIEETENRWQSSCLRVSRAR